MSDQPQNIKHEAFDALEILNYKKVALTAWTFLRNPRKVIDSNAKGEDDFVKPVKFLLAIGTPVIIALNIFGPDLGVWQMTDFFKTHMVNPDPAARAKDEFIGQTMTSIANKFSGELSPLVYLVVLPGYAWIAKLFYKKEKQPFYYFLSIAYYVGGILCLWDLTSLFLFSFFEFRPAFEYINMTIDMLILLYFSVKILPGSSLIRVSKSLAILLIFGTTFWTLFLTALMGTLAIKMGGFKQQYHMKHIMGENPVALGGSSDSLKLKYGLKTDTGLVIVSIWPDSPAERSGLMEGDVMIKIKGRVILGYLDERIALDSLKTGDSVKVLINRAGKELTFRVQVLPEDSIVKTPKVFMGFRRQFLPHSVNQPGYKNGSKVLAVTKNSPAEKAGVQIDDIVVSVDGDTISTIRRDIIMMQRVQQKKVGDTTRLGVVRGDNFLEIKVVMAKADKAR